MFRLTDSPACGKTLASTPPLGRLGLRQATLSFINTVAEMQGGPLSLNLVFIYARRLVTMAFLGAHHTFATRAASLRTACVHQPLPPCDWPRVKNAMTFFTLYSRASHATTAHHSSS